MPSFQTTDTLIKALRAAGLAGLVDLAVAAVRPVILFRRHQVADASLLPNASKLGGTPMLPAEFRWPHREAYADAPRLAGACRKLGAQLARSLAERRAERLSRPLRPGERMIEAAEVDAMVAEYDLIAETFSRSFPLAFVAQLDLASLSELAGFEAWLPRTGTLSIFCDATSYAFDEAVVVWDDKAGFPQEPPEDLLLYYAAHVAKSGRPWQDCQEAEALLPFSAVDLPDRWPSAPGFEEWLSSVESYSPPATPADGMQAEFGDRLGGYARNQPVQLEQSNHSETALRHLFTWGAEYFYGTRLIPIEALHDGQAITMISEQDLARGRLQKARANIRVT